MGRARKGDPQGGPYRKFCKWCKAVDGPFTTHNTTECRRFNKDGSQKDRPKKPFDSVKTGKSQEMKIPRRKRWRSSKRGLRNLRSEVRNVLITCRIVIPTVNRIMGPVARVDQ